MRMSFSNRLKSAAFRLLPVPLLRLLPRRWQVALATAHLAAIGRAAREALLAALAVRLAAGRFENDTASSSAHAAVAARRALITTDPPTRSMH